MLLTQVNTTEDEVQDQDFQHQIPPVPPKYYKHYIYICVCIYPSSKYIT
jgi:hypothetical protein